jgi:hypothetical protein
MAEPQSPRAQAPSCRCAGSGQILVNDLSVSTGKPPGNARLISMYTGPYEVWNLKRSARSSSRSSYLASRRTGCRNSESLSGELGDVTTAATGQ